MSNSKLKTEQNRLNMGQWQVTDSPQCELIAPSLGSCVALCLYDSVRAVGGMAHVVLPSRTQRSIPVEKQNDPYPSAKYADEAVLLLINEMIKLVGHSDLHLTSKLAGGAQMFKGAYQSNPDHSDDSHSKKGFPLIGKNNADVLERELGKFNIPIKGRDLGGTWGRTVTFVISTGEVFIQRIGSSERTLI